MTGYIGALKYQTLLFDADDTLLNFPRTERAALRKLFADYGIPCTEQLLRRYYEGNQKLWRMLERGELDKPTLLATRFRLFFDSIGRTDDPLEANARYLDYLSQKAYHMPHAIEVCRKLSQACELYVITNGVAAVQYGRWAVSPLRKYFRAIFVSEEIGAEKPSPVFYRSVLNRIPQQDKRRILVIGDSVISDIGGGKNAGLDTCLYARSARMREIACDATYRIGDLRELYRIVGLSEEKAL